MSEGNKHGMQYISGPKALCTGTITPCPAGNKCKHFGVHKCGTFKKHQKKCPHFPEYEFICLRVK